MVSSNFQKYGDPASPFDELRMRRGTCKKQKKQKKINNQMIHLPLRGMIE